MVKTLRKYKVSIIFATQELADVSNSSISHTIISQTVTKIFLPDESALMPNVYKFYADAALLILKFACWQMLLEKETII
jgi:type IV secretion system protein VirB4